MDSNGEGCKGLFVDFGTGTLGIRITNTVLCPEIGVGATSKKKSQALTLPSV